MRPATAGLAALVLCLAACNRQAATASSDPAPPAVAPATADAPAAAKHYTLADYTAKCFKYPDQKTLLEYKMVGLQGQDAIDHNYLQQEEMMHDDPRGACGLQEDIRRHQQAQRAGASQGGWIENAPANDMSHYGDALPHGH
jgi:hypothetical protein